MYEISMPWMLYGMFTHIQIDSTISNVRTYTLSLCGFFLLCVDTCDPNTWLYTTEFQLCRDNVHIFILNTSNDIHTQFYLASFRMQADAVKIERLETELGGMRWLSSVKEIQSKRWKHCGTCFPSLDRNGWENRRGRLCAMHILFVTFLQPTYRIYSVYSSDHSHS